MELRSKVHGTDGLHCSTRRSLPIRSVRLGLHILWHTRTTIERHFLVQFLIVDGQFDAIVDTSSLGLHSREMNDGPRSRVN